VIIPGRWSSDGHGGGISATVSNHVYKKSMPRRNGVLPIPGEEPSVYEYLQRVGGRDGSLQQQIDKAAVANQEWAFNEDMNDRWDHKAMADRADPNDGEVAWTDTEMWDKGIESVSSYFHVLGWLVAHGGRQMHNHFCPEGKKGVGAVGCRGMIDWTWSALPATVRPKAGEGWYDTAYRSQRNAPPPPPPPDYSGGLENASSSPTTPDWD
jgi:hypothetical protein